MYNLVFPISTHFCQTTNDKEMIFCSAKHLLSDLLIQDKMNTHKMSLRIFDMRSCIKSRIRQWTTKIVTHL